MASAKNQVIAGDYNGSKIYSSTGNQLGIGKSTQGYGYAAICAKPRIESYELITEDKVKSGTSAILRGMAGVSLLGGVGILAGLSAKNKGIYTIAIQWKDGKKSLIEIDDKLYKKFITEMF